MRRVRRLLLVGVLLVAALGVVLVARGLRTPAPAPAAPTGRVTLSAPAEVAAGGVLAVAVEVLEAPSPPLVVTSGTASVVLPVPAGGDATVDVPAHLTRVSGLLTVAPLGAPGDGIAVAVVPGVPVDPATPLVGQRSVVVGEQDAMVTVVPADALGNPVAPGTSVLLRARRPGGAEEAFTTATDGLLAWTWVPSGVEAGRTILGVEVGPARGPAADLVEVPAAPVEVIVAVEGGVPPADGRSTFTLRTEELRDRFGNLLPDGLHADVLVEGPTGTWGGAAQVVGGRVTTPVVVPDEPGRLTVVVRVDGVASAPLAVEVPPAVAELGATAEVVDGRIVVRVGPVLDPRGAYLPEGTDVTVDEVATQLLDGRATADLADDGRTAVTVTIAGTSVRVPVVRP